MARPVALSVLRGRIRVLADIGADTTSTTARWPNARLNTEINQSWQALRRRLVQTNGAKSLYCKLATGSTASGVTAGKAWTDLALPADLAHLVGLELFLTTNRWRALKAIAFDQRTQFYNVFGAQTGAPRNFFLYNMGVESTTTVAAGLLGLLPATDRAYVYNLWYVPAWVDKANDTDVFDGVEGWDDWVIWDAVYKIATADGGAEGGMGSIAQLAATEREKVQDDILYAANAVQREGPITRIDVVGQEATELYDEIWRTGNVW